MGSGLTPGTVYPARVLIPFWEATEDALSDSFFVCEGMLLVIVVAQGSNAETWVCDQGGRGEYTGVCDHVRGGAGVHHPAAIVGGAGDCVVQGGDEGSAVPR
jgi:hypothetical protein